MRRRTVVKCKYIHGCLNVGNTCQVNWQSTANSASVETRVVPNFTNDINFVAYSSSEHFQ